MDDKTNHERARSRIQHAMTIAEELAESRDRPTFDAAHFVTRVSGCEMHLSEARDLCLELTSLESMRGTRQALDALTTKLRAQFAEELERALAEREARGVRSVAETVRPRDLRPPEAFAQFSEHWKGVEIHAAHASDLVNAQIAAAKRDLLRAAAIDCEQPDAKRSKKRRRTKEPASIGPGFVKPPSLRELEAPCIECGEPLRGAEGTTCNACKDLGVDK